AEPEPGGHPVVCDLHVPLYRTGIDEADRVQLVIGQDGDLVLHTVQEHEVAAGLEPENVRPDAAELKATEAAEAASVEALEHRGVRPGPRGHTAGGHEV